MSPDPQFPDEFQRAVDQFLRSKGKGSDGESGHYRRNASREIENFIEWVVDHRVESFAELDEEGYIMWRRYARTLADRDVRPQTIQTYWNYLSAWTGWAARDGLLEQNYAQQTAAKEPLPDQEGRRTRDQQTWSSEQRGQITRYVRDRAAEAIDEDGHEAIQAVRDRALVFMLAYTGIRAGEFLRDTADDRRDGIRWSDVDLEREQVVVLSKKQDLDERPLTPLVVPTLERLQSVLDPPSDEWPVFPSLALPTLYERAREHFRARDIGDDRIKERLDAVTGLDGILSVYRDEAIQPPSMSTNGARQRMQKLTEAAGVQVDDRHDYLAPHGGRRGVGRVLVETRSVEAAAEQLDNSVRVVEDHYSDVIAEQQSKDVGDAFQEYD